MKHTIEIWRVSSVKNEYGEVVDTPSLIRKVKAQVQKASGKKIEDNDEIFSTISIKVQTWNHYGITEKDMIKYDGNMYTVDFIEPGYYGNKQTLVCTRINE